MKEVRREPINIKSKPEAPQIAEYFAQILLKKRWQKVMIMNCPTPPYQRFGIRFPDKGCGEGPPESMEHQDSSQ